ncbi:MarR family winged helix-turn-helix transcriptional regulator [Enterococcus sp. SMC-9]|uniref:MarR family winged helix-turn-helix transcriptional regulator n=1 Tax=Enterococcus sp. SMC-9 TaxID=2862343 RepID=UPI001E6230D7|nr:MarR family transcriptional regulator [Enterococcus sp. SMC-9]MCD1024235.1 MarR family transcriptional regulator [Enterococcus sp. SMC-9]
MKEEVLFEEFQRLNRLMRRRLKHKTKKEEFSFGQNRLLRILARHEGHSQKELAEMMHIRPASLSELLKKLSQKGYLIKKQNETDRRITNYFLTAEGKSYISSIQDEQKHLGQDLFATLSTVEKEQLHHILNKLTTRLEAE